MGRNDWYRRSTWTNRDQDEFFQRLNRSRSLSSKVQYLIIQAQCLRNAGGEKNIRAALELLDMYFNVRGDDEFFDASALGTKALCHFALEEYDAAIDCYRKTLSRPAEISMPQAAGVCPEISA
jgi:tetratricopeptide (TPR) repeat protein